MKSRLKNLSAFWRLVWQKIFFLLALVVVLASLYLLVSEAIRHHLWISLLLIVVMIFARPLAKHNKFVRRVYDWGFLLAIGGSLYLQGGFLSLLFIFGLFILLINFYDWGAFISDLPDNCLVEDLDLDRFLQEKRYQYRQKKYREKDFEISLLESLYYYYKGDFEASLGALADLDALHIKNDSEAKRSADVTRLRLLNSLQLKDFKQSDAQHELYIMLASISKKHELEKLHAIYELQQGRPYSYFSNLEPQNKLDHMEFTYYQGLNYLNMGERLKAGACFSEIVDLNPEFFYVRKAKQHLAEMA